MRSRILLGLALVASAAAASCSNEPVTTPTDLTLSPSVASWGAMGRMTGGGGQLVTIGDVYVTRGFTIHCDITLSNNLEINWPGNKWHLDKPLTGAVCLDDPAISPEPPPAPFDTFIGEGIGRLNGVDGSLVRFQFVDAGEPGGNNDRSSIHIYDPNGVLVLAVPMSFLTKGNLQAHYDQPHGNKP